MKNFTLVILSLFCVLTGFNQAYAQCNIEHIPSPDQLGGWSNGTSIGQTFTAECDGELDELQIMTSATDYTNVTLELFIGSQVTTPALQETGKSLVTGTGGWKIITLDTPFSVTNGQQYTFYLTNNESNANITVSQTDTYAGGGSWLNGSPWNPYDLAFRCNSLAPLPVELASFHAEVVKGGIKLYWSTAAEIDNAGFYLYRNGKKISHFIPGAGTTSEPQEYSFTDKDVQPDVLYVYQISDIEEGTGKETLHPAITIIASKEALQAKEIPEAYKLHANYPNPFNPTTTIEFDVPVGTYNYTSLRIYDASGKLVKTLFDEPMDAGKYSVSWHGKDDNGNAVSSGTYYCKMVTEAYSETRQLLLLK
jgi:hypothetical protein